MPVVLNGELVNQGDNYSHIVAMENAYVKAEKYLPIKRSVYRVKPKEDKSGIAKHVYDPDKHAWTTMTTKDVQDREKERFQGLYARGIGKRAFGRYFA